MKTKIIFFGNGPLADGVLKTLEDSDDVEIIFHARTREDLAAVKKLKTSEPGAFGVLASFGVLIRNDVLDLFEPEGILNIHPSLLPKYRGASPIESAILSGDREFSVSVMKLVRSMDAGPVYYQTTIRDFSSEYPEKSEIYARLAAAGAGWLKDHLRDLPVPAVQDENEATYTAKFNTSMSALDPEDCTALELLNHVRAFAGFPKSKYVFAGLDCTVIRAHLSSDGEKTALDAGRTSKTAGPRVVFTKKLLALRASDGNYLVIDEIQPAGRRVMNAAAFKNGYLK